MTKNKTDLLWLWLSSADRLLERVDNDWTLFDGQTDRHCDNLSPYRSEEIQLSITNLHFEGYLKNVTSDMKTLRPTILPAVPRFLNRIHKECVATANKTSLFRQVDKNKIVITSNSGWLCLGRTQDLKKKR